MWCSNHEYLLKYVNGGKIKWKGERENAYKIQLHESKLSRIDKAKMAKYVPKGSQVRIKMQAPSR